MMKNLFKFIEFLIFGFCILFSLIIALDKSYSSVVLDGVKLWFACVLPSLLPYFFITAILSSLKVTSKVGSFCSPLTKRVFNVSGAVGYAYFMSLISGYPIGAKIVSDLKSQNALSKAESVRASVLCSTSSPMFMISSVGSIMFNSSKFGILLFLTHLTCSIIIGVIFSFYKRAQTPSEKPYLLNKGVDNILYESAYSSVVSVLVVGGLITIFYLLTQILYDFHLLDGVIWFFSLIFKNENLATGLSLGVFECTKGLKYLSACGVNMLSLPLCALICGFGGISIIMQSVAYLKKAKIKTTVFVFSKLLSAVLNFFVGLIFSLVFF
ncbi:MAG: hypothetical protein E7348_03955 [Clostridiales bacterium]|nr:hypothetical protein [Clostridiales bacterium]